MVASGSFHQQEKEEELEESIDSEWLQLIMMARYIGISPEEIRNFLLQLK